MFVNNSLTPVSLRNAIFLLLVLSALLAINSADSWRYKHDDTGRSYTSYARSHLTLGLEGTKGQDFFYDRRDGMLIPYGHRPPGLGLLLAGWFWLWGNDEPFAARALAASFHLFSACLLLGLIRCSYPGRPGLIAGLAFAVVPMSSFFGKLVCYPPFLLSFIILFLVSYWKWAENGSSRWLVLSVFLIPLAVGIDWMILLAAFTAGVDAARRYRRGEGGRFAIGSLLFCTIGLLSFFAVALWLASGPAGWDGLIGPARFRTRLGDDYSWWRWLGKMLDYNRRYFTEPVLVAAVASALLMIREVWSRQTLTPRARLLVLFGVAGLLPVIVFPNSARYHHYWQFYLLPYAVLSLAYVLDVAASRLTPCRLRFLHAAIVVWVVTASATTLWYRYTHPSGYVDRMLSEWEFYL